MKAMLKRIGTILSYIRQLEPRALYDGVAAAVLNAVKPFVMLIVSKLLIEAVLVKTDYIVLLRQILLLLTLHFLLSAFGGYFEKRSEYYFKRFMRKHDMNKAEHLLEIPYAWTENDSMQGLLAEILNMESKNVFSPRSFSSRVFKTCGSIVSLLLAIIFIAGMFTRKVALGGMPAWCLDIGFVVIFVALFSTTLKIVSWINVKFGEVIGRESGPMMRYLKAYNTLIYQYKNGKDVRLFSKELAKGYTDTYRKFQEKMFTLLSDLFTKNITVETMMASLSNGVIYFFIAIKALYGGIRISEIVLYIGAFSELTRCAMELIDSISMIFAGDLYREKLIEYYALGAGEKEARDVLYEATETAPFCCVKELSFRYPGSEKTVLKNISFNISQGEKLAIVGENGSGKTTLIKILVGLYRQYDGDIILDEKNAREIPAENIGRLFAPVFQDFKLLAFTLKDNVACFTETSEAQIKEVLTQVGMREFYDVHGSNVYLTRNFENTGVEISGGEAQKIAMARAMMKNAPIFVLDEPTAALDPISEREIYEKFNEITQGKTAVFISHRLSSCKFCDRILVLDKGELVQMGSHEMLLKEAQGKYRELWNAQSRHYT